MTSIATKIDALYRAAQTPPIDVKEPQINNLEVEKTYKVTSYHVYSHTQLVTTAGGEEIAILAVENNLRDPSKAQVSPPVIEYDRPIRDIGKGKYKQFEWEITPQ